MWIIISLIVLGVLLLVAELILLPGTTIAGIAALASYGAAVYISFDRFGTTGGLIAIGTIVVLSILGTAISLRAKTWQRLSLKQTVEGTSQSNPEDTVAIGTQGVTITRLNPLGKVEISGETYEARALGDIYIDPGQKIEVTGFRNFTLVVNVLDEQQ